MAEDSANSGRKPRRVLASTGDLLPATRVRETGRQVGAWVELAAPGPGAARPAAEFSPDIILVALEERDDPLAAVLEPKADRRTRGMPVVGVYSHVNVELRRRALEAGCDRALPRSAFGLPTGRLAQGHVLGAGPAGLGDRPSQWGRPKAHGPSLDCDPAGKLLAYGAQTR